MEAEITPLKDNVGVVNALAEGRGIGAVSKYRLLAPSNPNVAAPGLDWEVDATILQDDDTWDVGIDDFPVCLAKGYWRATGMVAALAGAARDQLYIRLKINGVYSEIIGVSGTAANNTTIIAGTFHHLFRVTSDGQTVAVNTYQAVAAGVCTGHTVGGVNISFVQFEPLGDL